MSTDYLTMADDEVRTLFGQIAEVVKALQTASVNYRPSICSECYLTGDEVCEYLHISVRTLQTLRDRRELPFTVVGERTILYPESGIREVMYKNYRPAEDPF